MTEFNGWDASLREFFVGLERENTKEYFDAHRELYQHAVREPAEALVAALEPHYGKGRIFRLNRDIRFSTDKRPYHTNIGVEFSNSDAHYYVSASASELFVSVGMFRPDRAWVERFRQAVAGPAGEQLRSIVEDLEKQGFQIGGEELKRIPRGYPADHSNARLLRYRGITANRRWLPTQWLGNSDTLSLITGTWRQAAPLSDWLRINNPVGD